MSNPDTTTCEVCGKEIPSREGLKKTGLPGYYCTPVHIRKMERWLADTDDGGGNP